jgi:type III secretion system low calcium response chaperone LcrH/SycD
MSNTSKKTTNPALNNEAKNNFISKTVYSVFKNGTPLYKVKGMSKQHLENLYTVAYNLYSAEKYEEAGKLFKAITFYNYTDKKSWLGAAASAEMLKKYDKAIIGYVFASRLDRFDPLPLLHAFDCHLALKNYPAAVACLDMVMLRASKKPEYFEIKKRAEHLKNILQQAIQEATRHS